MEAAEESRKASAPRARQRIGEHYIWSFTICGTYQATHLLGEGENGCVVRAFHILTGSEVAVKIESLPAEEGRRPFLEYEVAIYKLLTNPPLGIPSVHWSGRDGNHAVLILDRLGPNLGALQRFCRGSFTLRTICMLAEQLLSSLEFVHSRGVIVCDLKPQNIAMGVGKNANVAYLLDFGHARLYIDPDTNTHVPATNPRHTVGTPQYASVAAHARTEVSRRDDVESLLYVLLDLYHGTLPWRGQHFPDGEDWEQRVSEIKAGTVFLEFLAKLPPEFSEYHAHVTGLPFGQQPNYELLRNLFRRRMREEGWEPDSEFDWAHSDLERGTLIPDEYVIDKKYVSDMVDLDP
ncbi:kinase-like domain-containing protein [Trametes elegans]|nr:kinase-like domain-containing protein [Trametes elegans]